MPWRQDPAAAADRDAVDQIRGLLQRPHDPSRLDDQIAQIVRSTGRACRPHGASGPNIHLRCDDSSPAGPAGIVIVPAVATIAVRVDNDGHLHITVASDSHADGCPIQVTVDGRQTFPHDERA